MITTRTMPALLPAHHRRVAQPQIIASNDFADPLDRRRAHAEKSAQGRSDDSAVHLSSVF